MRLPSYVLSIIPCFRITGRFLTRIVVLNSRHRPRVNSWLNSIWPDRCSKLILCRHLRSKTTLDRSPAAVIFSHSHFAKVNLNSLLITNLAGLVFLSLLLSDLSFFNHLYLDLLGSDMNTALHLILKNKEPIDGLFFVFGAQSESCPGVGLIFQPHKVFSFHFCYQTCQRYAATSSPIGVQARYKVFIPNNVTFLETEKLYEYKYLLRLLHISECVSGA